MPVQLLLCRHFVIPLAGKKKGESDGLFGRIQEHIEFCTVLEIYTKSETVSIFRTAKEENPALPSLNRVF